LKAGLEGPGLDEIDREEAVSERHREERSEEIALDVGEGASLVLRADTGRIRVEAVEAAVTARFEIVVAASAESSAEARRSLERVRIESRGHRGWGEVEVRIDRDDEAPGCDVEIRALVPFRSDLELDVAAGSIAIDRLRGDVKAKSASGSLSFGTIDGTVSAACQSGALRLEHASGPVTVEAKAGPVEIASAGDAVRIRHVAGPVAVRFTGQPRGESRIETMAGPVRVEIAGDVGVDLDAATRAGRVAAGAGLPDSGSRAIRGPVHGGGPLLLVRSFAGQISIDAGAAMPEVSVAAG